jgi:sulfur-carrier protein adenylyltransferase/sulfurtransferase
MKKIILLVFGVILLVLIPVLAGGTTAAPVVSEFDVIAEAADSYLNAPTTVWNIAEKDLCSNLLDRNEDNDPFILSIRAADIYALGHVPGAVNIPMAEVFETENLARLPQDKKIVVYCYTGHTGSRVAALLNLCGYDASNLKWGMTGWTKDTEVAPYRFDPDSAMDYPFETSANTLSGTYSLPTIENTASTSAAEIVRTACYNYASGSHGDIKATDLYALLSDGDPDNDPIIVSVRSAEQYAKGHIPGAVNIALTDVAKKENLQRLDPDKQIVVYCYTGRTGSQATAILNVLGYNATNLHWGMTAWTKDTDVAPAGFNPDTSMDYPCETGAGETSPTTPSDGGGCG